MIFLSNMIESMRVTEGGNGQDSSLDPKSLRRLPGPWESHLTFLKLIYCWRAGGKSFGARNLMGWRDVGEVGQPWAGLILPQSPNPNKNNGNLIKIIGATELSLIERREWRERFEICVFRRALGAGHRRVGFSTNLILRNAATSFLLWSPLIIIFIELIGMFSFAVSLVRSTHLRPSDFLSFPPSPFPRLRLFYQIVIKII